MRCSITLRRLSATAAVAAAVPRNYSNTPYVPDDSAQVVRNANKSKPTPTNRGSLATCRDGTGAVRRHPVPLPPPTALCAAASAGGTFIDPSSSTVSTRVDHHHQVGSFRQRVCAATDVSMRPLLLLLDDPRALSAAPSALPGAAEAAPRRHSYGELLQQLSCRWAAKFYGKVTFGPRNYPYPSSRWLARRFQMKKHRILKRFRFRRYKLAAVANLPFAKMIRVGMLPELKSSKTKKGDAVDMGLSSQLVTAARSSAGATKSKGKRTRPKSKYQV
ncbi:hypothetical protein NESM_000356000 [Novymonas esmeraldas]|uniref:Uncharacterized protein n=1 Tax=Novymonas esmeraldas TaxID=1808958 RepID=A0AAW0EJQ2_9TRYP